MLNVLAYVHLRRIVRSTGAGRIARCLTEHLSRLPGVDVRILGDSGDYRQIADEAGPGWTRLRHHLFDRQTSVQQALWLFLARPEAESFWPDVQVTFCTSESYVPVKRSRLLVVLNDAAHMEKGIHPEGAALWKQRLKWNYLYRVLEHKADAFLTSSQFSAERLSHFRPAVRNRLHVIPHGVAPCFFEPPTAEACAAVRALGLEEGRFVMLPSGLDHRKNAELVLDAWPIILESAPEWKLIVTSNASDPAYASRARALGGSIVIPGHVDDDVMRALYHLAAVVWFPSRYEGFGLPVLEAMACGAPVVASRAASLPEVAGDAALLAPPDDRGAHIDAIRSIATDAQAAAPYRLRGPQRAREFDWSRSAADLKRLMERVI